MHSQPSRRIETFANPSPQRDYHIHIQVPEFTCLCPLTGQPDFAVLYIDYVPDQLCMELKSLKLYAWSYRNEGAFHEAVSNSIFEDMVSAMSPRFLRLTSRFGVRGGIFTNIVIEHRQEGWQCQEPVYLHAFPKESSFGEVSG